MHPTANPRSEALKAFVWLVTAAGVVLPVGLLFYGIWAGLCFMCGGDYPDGGAPYHRAAAVAGIVGPVVGIGFSFVTRQVAPRVLLGLVLVITAGSIALNYVEVNTAPVDDGPRYCQEHSGGDTTCPGG